MNTKKKLRDDEDAVSPVVGVILMVAITVIMAAVIGAFVYGYGGSMVTTKNVAATAHFSNRAGTDYVSAIYMGGPDQDTVTALSALVFTEAGASVTMATTSAALTSVVGCTETFGGVAAGLAAERGKNHVIVTATFRDLTEQVILDTWV